MLALDEVAPLAATIGDLTGSALDELHATLSGLDPEDAAGFKQEALIIVPDLLDTYAGAAAGATADMYEEWRELEAVPGTFRATPAQLARLAVVEANVGWAMTSMYGADPSVKDAITNLGGGLTRHITAAAGNTVIRNVAQDRKATGWVRIAQPTACLFCKMLSGRRVKGMYSGKSVRFKSHDNCKCSVAPSWDEESATSLDDLGIKFENSTRNITDSMRQDMYEYLRTHEAKILAEAVTF